MLGRRITLPPVAGFCLLALSGCMPGDPEAGFAQRGALPVAAELLGEEVRLRYPDGRICAVTPDPGTVRGEEWSAARPDCPGVRDLNVRYRFENTTIPGPDGTMLSTLRMEDSYFLGGPLATPGRAPDARRIEVVFDTGEGQAGFPLVGIAMGGG